MMIIKSALQLLKPISKGINVIKLHAWVSEQHMSKMCEICIWLRKNNHPFITEAEFKEGGRADILVLDLAVAIEILHTETKDKFEKKKYPVPMIPIRTDEPWRGLI